MTEEKIPQICEALETLASQHQDFSLKLAGLAAFPAMEKGRVIRSRDMDRSAELHQTAAATGPM